VRRRTLLVGVAGLAGTWVLPAGAAQTDSGEGVTVDIALGNDQPDSVLAILREVDAKNIQQVKQSGLGGIETVVAGILLAKGLANLIVRLLPIWQCGIVVDARAARILTEKNCDLPRGTVLVINPDGTRSRIPQPSAPQIQSLVENFARPK
jgi:hypothetical protein